MNNVLKIWDPFSFLIRKFRASFKLLRPTDLIVHGHISPRYCESVYGGKKSDFTSSKEQPESLGLSEYVEMYFLSQDESK